MPEAPATPITGIVTGDVESRFTESGVAISRFRLTSTPREWDAANSAWRDGKPIHYVCTLWRETAANAAESLVHGIEVLVHGRITDVRDSTLWISVDAIGVSLRQRIVYTEASLPGPAAAAPIIAPPPPRPAAPSASRPAARRPGNPPHWWEEQRSANRPATAADRATLRTSH